MGREPGSCVGCSGPPVAGPAKQGQESPQNTLGTISPRASPRQGPGTVQLAGLRGWPRSQVTFPGDPPGTSTASEKVGSRPGPGLGQGSAPSEAQAAGSWDPGSFQVPWPLCGPDRPAGRRVGGGGCWGLFPGRPAAVEVIFSPSPLQNFPPSWINKQQSPTSTKQELAGPHKSGFQQRRRLRACPVAGAPRAAQRAGLPLADAAITASEASRAPALVHFSFSFLFLI